MCTIVGFETRKSFQAKSRMRFWTFLFNLKKKKHFLIPLLVSSENRKGDKHELLQASAAVSPNFLLLHDVELKQSRSFVAQANCRPTETRKPFQFAANIVSAVLQGDRNEFFTLLWVWQRKIASVTKSYFPNSRFFLNSSLLSFFIKNNNPGFTR